MLHTLRLATPALFLLFFAAGALAQDTSSAAKIPESTYQALRWRCIGPHRGGRALAVSGVRGQPETYYFGAVGGGVWKTTDAGDVWQPIFDDQPISSIGALAVAPSDPNTIYVGSGEADMRSDISFGDGLLDQTRSVEYFARLTVGSPGPGPFIRTKTWERSSWRPTLIIRARFTPQCGIPADHRGVFMLPSPGRAADSINRLMTV